MESFKGFSKLNRSQRLQVLQECGVLSANDANYLNEGGLQDFNLGEKLIENVIGYFQLPLGVVVGLKVDEKEYIVPMAVEETSIIAAASKTAKWIREQGRIETEVLGNEVIGQIQIPKAKNVAAIIEKINLNKNNLIERANRDIASGLVARGGGVRDIVVRFLSRQSLFDKHQENSSSGFPILFGFNAADTNRMYEDLGGSEIASKWNTSADSNDNMVVIHVHLDPVEAMGANIVNQVCEYLKKPIEEITDEKVGLCILSNLVDTKLTRSRIILENIDTEIADKISEASLFAEVDPYRAATNNKGVLNGIDPILVATGNDWRAVEAGVHSYAARSGQYRSITCWRRHGNQLVGELLAPLVVGTVGGVTKLHPTARLALNMMKIEKSSELSRVLAAMGLVQNLGALRALTTVGIIEGHMKLHIQNLLLSVGANEDEFRQLQLYLENILKNNHRISQRDAELALRQLRENRKKT